MLLITVLCLPLTTTQLYPHLILLMVIHFFLPVNILLIIDEIQDSYTSGDIVNFYIRSSVTTSSHTFEYIGSGVTLSAAVPALGGVGDFAKEAVYGDGGIVYFTSTNQAGNFRVGNEFTIVQETGTIEGDTFKRAILALVTPLVLSLE